MKTIYKTVTNAFSDLDYTGKGKVREDDFFRTLVIYKLPYTKEVSQVYAKEVKEYFIWENVFKGSSDESLGLNEFRKHFFPDSEYVET